MLAVVEVDTSPIVDELVSHLDHLGRLRDLEREIDVGHTRYTRLEALSDGILGAILVILLPLRHRTGKIRNLPIGRINDDALSCTDTKRSRVRLDVAVDRVVQNLPDSRKVRLAIGGSRNCRCRCRTAPRWRCCPSSGRGSLPSSGSPCRGLA